MIRVREIISKTDFSKIFSEYQKHYSENRSRVKNVFEKIANSKVAKNPHDMTIYITAIKENEDGEDVILKEFDSDDRTIFFDVSGKSDNYDGVYSIADASYEDLLSFFVSDDTLKKFTPSQIIAHILWALYW